MRAVLPLVVLLGLAACSRESSVPAPAAAKPAPVVAPPADVAEDSVSAVLQSSGKPAVSLRFALEGKPTVGKSGPVRLDLAGDPGSLTLRLQGDGLAIDPVGATVVLADDGKPVSQSFAVKPRAAGIAEIRVHIQPPGENAPEVVYAIPLLVEGAAAK